MARAGDHLVNPILAIVPYTGSERLVTMTETMLDSLRPTLAGHNISVWLAANKPSRLAHASERGAFQMDFNSNGGFGPGINAVLHQSACSRDVLILNNDLTFPQVEWLSLLREEQARDEQPFIYAPRTNCTATPEACKDGPENKPAQRVRQVSAFCWLVPAVMRARLRSRTGIELFPPEFPNYGSDDAAAAWFRKLYGATPFKVVHRAFVKHAKGQTAKETGDRPGDPAVLKRLRGYFRQHNL